MKKTDLKFDKLENMRNFFCIEKESLSDLEKKFYYDCMENFDSDFKFFGFENVEGGIDEGAKVKNFHVIFGKESSKITIYYLVDRLKLKISKIDGLDTPSAAKTIHDFYENPQFSNENLKIKFDEIYKIYQTLKNNPEDLKVEVIPILKKFYNISGDKIPTEKRVELSFMLHKIKSLEIMTSDGKRLGTSKATGQFQTDPNHFLSLPVGDTVDIDNVMYLTIN